MMRMQHAKEKHVEVTFQQFESPHQQNVIKWLQTQLGQTPRLIGRVYVVVWKTYQNMKKKKIEGSFLTSW
jgi:hypothetical protein